jgi:hypothetical protein
MVPTFTSESIGEGDARLYPGSIATPTPQAFTVASPPDPSTGFGVGRPDPKDEDGHALHTGPYPSGLSTALDLRGVRRRFLSYAFSPCLPDPGRLTVPARPVRCRGCFPP